LEVYLLTPAYVDFISFIDSPSRTRPIKNFSANYNPIKNYAHIWIVFPENPKSISQCFHSGYATLHFMRLWRFKNSLNCLQNNQRIRKMSKNNWRFFYFKFVFRTFACMVFSSLSSLEFYLLKFNSLATVKLD
jgi:hypothetical protein